jgi:hypothetical protein
MTQVQTEKTPDPKENIQNDQVSLEKMTRVANAGLPGDTILKCYEHRSGKSDIPVLDPLSVLVVSYMELAHVYPDGLDRFIAAAGYINGAAAELENIKDSLVNAGLDFVLLEFWNWFGTQNRSVFTLQLLFSWMDVHPSPDLNHFRNRVVERLMERMPELKTFKKSEEAITPERLVKIKETLSGTKPLETPAEPDKASA